MNEIKKYIIKMVKYLFLSIIEKFWLSLMVWWILISSMKWIEFLPKLFDFLHKILPYFFDNIKIPTEMHLSSDELFLSIKIIYTFGIPLATFFLFIWFFIDLFKNIFWINWSIKNWLKNHKKNFIIILYFLSFLGIYSIIKEDWNIIKSILASIIFSSFLFWWLLVISILPWLFIFIYIPKLNDLKIAKKYDFLVQEPYKTFILNGQKTIEWRLNKWIFSKINIWNILCFESWENFIVIWKKEYKTFSEMIKKEWIEKVIPDAKSIEEATNVYYKFYTKEQEKKFWVVAIEIKKIKSY